MAEPRTSKPEYGPYILKALHRIGGGSVDDTLEETFRLMRHRLHPKDLVILPGGAPRWIRQAENMLDGLIGDGYVAETNGLLALTSQGLDYLSDL